MDESKSRIPPKSPRHEPGAPGTRTPTKGESSSDSASSAETVIGIPGLGNAPKISSDDSAPTVLDAGPNTPYRGGPLRSGSGLFSSAAILRIGDVLGCLLESRSKILLRSVCPGSQQTVNYTVGTNPNSIVAGDFNGDGKEDLATVSLGDQPHFFPTVVAKNGLTP